MRRNRIRARLLSKPTISPTKQRKTLVLPVGTTKKIRNLDLSQLIAEARSLVDATSNRLAGLESDRREAADLLAQINEPGFWDRIDHREVVLDRYRALDVAIRMRERFAGPILHLVELLEDNPMSPPVLSPALEQAAYSFRQWEDCLAEEGHAEIWMVLSASDPLKSAGRWIRKLANMELAWSRHLGLTSSVAAYSIAENESVLTRLLPDLALTWSKQPAEVNVSRIYGKDGVIHDPRTGVTSNRIKEVWKGRLDEFLEGWRRTRS